MPKPKPPRRRGLNDSSKRRRNAELGLRKPQRQSVYAGSWARALLVGSATRDARGNEESVAGRRETRRKYSRTRRARVENGTASPGRREVTRAATDTVLARVPRRTTTPTTNAGTDVASRQSAASLLKLRLSTMTTQNASVGIATVVHIAHGAGSAATEDPDETTPSMRVADAVDGMIVVGPG